MKKGLTLIELIITISILAILTGLITYNFLSFSKNIHLESGGQEVISLLRFAQSQALAAIDDSNWGIHLETRKITVFKGDSFNPSDPSNKKYSLQGDTSLTAINLNPPGTIDTIFEKNKGYTQNWGSLTYSCQNTAKIIYIEENGRISE